MSVQRHVHYLYPIIPIHESFIQSEHIFTLSQICVFNCYRPNCRSIMAINSIAAPQARASLRTFHTLESLKIEVAQVRAQFYCKKFSIKSNGCLSVEAANQT